VRPAAKIVGPKVDDNDRARSNGHAELRPDEGVISAAPPSRPLPLRADAAARLEWSRTLPPPIPTGLELLDVQIGGGLQPEGVHFLNGPTGRGKSGLAIQIARHVGVMLPVLYLSTELSRRQVLARFAAQAMRRGWREIMTWPPERAGEVAAALSGLRLRVEDARAVEVRDLLNRIADEEGVAPLLVLDYIQNAARQGHPEDMRLAVAAYSDSIVEWAKESKSAALVVSSVGRPWHQDSDGRTASDYVTAAKEAGIEFDGAAVMFLDCKPPPLGGTSPARLHVSKARMGAPGTVGLCFDGPTGMFSPDASASLTEDQRKALDAIEAGAASVDEVRKAIGKKTTAAVELVRALAEMGLVKRTSAGIVVVRP